MLVVVWYIQPEQDPNSLELTERIDSVISDQSSDRKAIFAIVVTMQLASFFFGMTDTFKVLLYSRSST